MKKILQLSTAALLVCAATSSAATIVGYDFTTDLSATQVGANVIAGALNTNNGNTGMAWSSDTGNPIGTTEGIPFSTDVGLIKAGNSSLQTISRDLAIAGNDYFSFTVAPSSGYEMNLDKIVFSGLMAFDRANRAANEFALMSSITGFTTADTSLTEGEVTAWNDGSMAWDQITVDVSGNSAFQNITTSTEFRIYMWDGSSNGSQGAIYYDNVGVTGDVLAIPEPGTFALIGGLFALTSVMVRRRRS